jgi:hypothetical protein
MNLKVGRVSEFAFRILLASVRHSVDQTEARSVAGFARTITRAAAAGIAAVRRDCSNEVVSLLRDLFCSEADLTPDPEKRALEVQVHPMLNPRADRAIAHLLEHFNASEFTYPGTNLRLVDSIARQVEHPDFAPDQNPADQEV